ncbi:sugar kinase [Agrobacterium rubi]|uniref:Sugar kinase n=2 Tax=Rhizobium/Agrobacterium group TaxID=227290 RepID=A0AAE7R7X7_9HYPH|nr:sugar kinase [Agrobacterium rosae]NTE90191.1 sugar kinase [Agrobacterium rubi]NTF06010.1 sugar kinase [Agrobacterium rubi]NTF40249.1 sugar kinase [Agrobacterium rubi]QTG03498.1 sugar kinase [Agrobacterium rubi]
MATTSGEGFLSPQPLVGPFPSGAPAIFIDQVARIGGACGIVAAVGNDDFGRLNVERLKADGVDVSAIAISHEKPTGSAFVRYRPDGSRDFVYNIKHSAAGEVALTDAAQTLFSRAGHVHVMGSAFAISGLWSIILEAVSVVKNRGGSISFDPNLRKEIMQGEQARERLDAMLAVTDLLLPSGEELLVAADEESEASAVERLFEKGVREIVLKRGAEGASHFSHSFGRIDCPPFFVTEVDSTGAGDCFGAAYLTCRRMGLRPTSALLYANAAGALTVTKQGPMEGVSSKFELDQFIAAAGRGERV